jgi:uncharacterized OB-fold protein
MSANIELRPVAEGLFDVTPEGPALIGSECARCATVSFPSQRSCPRCTSTEVRDRHLSRRGTLWTWTIQCFRPKSPPYVEGDAAGFEPYGVGYVELPGELRVESLLTESDPERLKIGMPMELTLVAAPGRSDVATFAFRPAVDP